MQIDTKYQLEKVVSTDGLRKPLQNILISRDKNKKPIAIATNGRVLAMVPVTLEETDQTGLISPEALKASRKNKANPGQMIANGDIDLLDGRRLPRPTEDEVGNYPNWRQVVDGAPTEWKFQVSFNAAYLLSLAQALGCPKEALVTLSFKDELSPIVVHRNNSGEGEYGLLMPARIA